MMWRALNAAPAPSSSGGLPFLDIAQAWQFLLYLLHAAKQRHTQILVRHFAATEPQGDFHLVAFVKEAAHRTHFHIVIMIVNSWAHLDLLDLDDLLLLACFGGFFLLFVFVFSVVHQFDHGWFGFGRNLHKIKALLVRDSAGVIGTDLTVFVPVITNQKNGAGKDILVDTGPALGGDAGIGKTSGDYDSLLLCAVRKNASRA